MKLFLLPIIYLITSCTVTSHSVENVDIGKSINKESAVLRSSNSVVFKKVLAAKWQISLAGLLNLDDPKAVAANKKDKLESIEIYLYVFDHPTKGRFLIDTGVAEVIAKNGDDSPIPGIMKSMMNFDLLKTQITTKEFLKTSAKIKGVFLTHMHADHVFGFQDLPKDINIYVGPNEGTYKNFLNLPTRGTMDEIYKDHVK